MLVPTEPKIYHIIHVDRLKSVIADGYLWCDARIVRDGAPGTTIGMNSIKQRRLENPLRSHPGLNVGDCVPFYFCPRSVMLYVIHQQNHPELQYRGGQEPILHLEADVRQAVAWASRNNRRWAFTSSNAGSSYFNHYTDLTHLSEIDWDAVAADQWAGEPKKSHKQAEFLIEQLFPWELISRIGVSSAEIYRQVMESVRSSDHRPAVEVKPAWYY